MPGTHRKGLTMREPYALVSDATEAACAFQVLYLLEKIGTDDAQQVFDYVGSDDLVHAGQNAQQLLLESGLYLHSIQPLEASKILGDNKSAAEHFLQVCSSTLDIPQEKAIAQLPQALPGLRRSAVSRMRLIARYDAQYLAETRVATVADLVMALKKRQLVIASSKYESGQLTIIPVTHSDCLVYDSKTGTVSWTFAEAVFSYILPMLGIYSLTPPF